MCYTKNDWQGRVEFPNGEVVVFHSANAMAHYLTSTSPDAWGNTPVSPNMYSDVCRALLYAFLILLLLIVKFCPVLSQIIFKPLKFS